MTITKHDELCARALIYDKRAAAGGSARAVGRTRVLKTIPDDTHAGPPPAPCRCRLTPFRYRTVVLLLDSCVS